MLKFAKSKYHEIVFTIRKACDVKTVTFIVYYVFVGIYYYYLFF